MSWRLRRLERTAVARGYGGQRAEVPAFIAGKSHYYPFGMNHLGPWYETVAPENKYLYNGKELNGDYDIKLMDYGARWYDGAIGRWTAVDPLAEQTPSWSAFNYVHGNPIRLIDPLGLSAEEKDERYYRRKAAYDIWQTQRDAEYGLSTPPLSGNGPSNGGDQDGGEENSDCCPEFEFNYSKQLGFQKENNLFNLEKYTSLPNEYANLLTATEVMAGSYSLQVSGYIRSRSINGPVGYAPTKYDFLRLRYGPFKGKAVWNLGRFTGAVGAPLTIVGIGNAWLSDQSVGWKIADTSAGIASFAPGGFGLTFYYFMVKTGISNYRQFTPQQKIDHSFNFHPGGFIPRNLFKK